jgi:hypothetical protein
VDATDADALEAEIAEFFDQPNLEFPRLSPTDFVQPVVRAANNTQPVTEYRD